MQEYYKQEVKETEEKPLICKGVLDAKTAREMTNDAIINLIKNEVFPKIAERAKKGEYLYSFNMSRNIDYSIGIAYLKKLGYSVTSEFNSSTSLTVYLKW